MSIQINSFKHISYGPLMDAGYLASDGRHYRSGLEAPETEVASRYQGAPLECLVRARVKLEGEVLQQSVERCWIRLLSQRLPQHPEARPASLSQRKEGGE